MIAALIWDPSENTMDKIQSRIKEHTTMEGMMNSFSLQFHLARHLLRRCGEPIASKIDSHQHYFKQSHSPLTIKPWSIFALAGYVGGNERAQTRIISRGHSHDFVILIGNG